LSAGAEDSDVQVVDHVEADIACGVARSAASTPPPEQVPQ
jgi:hypothetical protein